MKDVKSLFRNLRRPGVTPTQQAQKVRKEMGAILPQLAAFQRGEIKNKEVRKNLAFEVLHLAWSLLQFFVILIQEVEKGEGWCQFEGSYLS